MKLFYTPGACSLSPHIVLRELGASFDLERVDLKNKVTESGTDYRTINPMGYVPALELDSGEVLTEGPAIVQYLADSNGATELAPKPGTLERARLQEHLNFVSAELHKSFSPLFVPTTTDEGKEAARANVIRRLDRLEKHFSDGREYLLGDTFTVADIHLYVVTSWSKPTGISLDDWPNVKAFWKRVRARPAVQAALEAEGLV